MSGFRLSYFGLIFSFCFLFLLLISRVLFPFADEPDWIVRAPGVLFGEHYIWSPYYFFSELLSYLNVNGSACKPVASALSIWAEISNSCTESLIQISIRFLVTLFVVFPMLTIFVFRLSFIRFMSSINFILSKEEWGRRIDSLALTIIFPGVLYYLGVLAEEQLFLVVALYIFLFWGFWLPVAFLLMILMSIDLGNSIVVLFYIISMFSFLNFFRFSRKKTFAFFIFLISVSFLVGYRFLDVLNQLAFLGDGFTSKSDAMYQALDSSELVNKYPVLLRPIITFMTFVFMTPSGIKIPILYVVVGFFTLILSFKVLKRRSKILDCYWFIPIFSIVFFVFLFPTYANAKYYIFMMPFFVYVALSFYTRKNVFLFFFSFSLVVFLHLIAYRL